MAERTGSLGRLKVRQAALEKAITNLPNHALTADSRARLLKLVRAEGRFVERLASCRLALSSSRLSSTNFAHLEAVVQILQHPLVSGASGVLQSFSAYASKDSLTTLGGGNYVTAHVDVVCSFDGKPVWVIASTRNPKYISWWDNGTKKGLRNRMLSLLLAACEDVVIQPAFILLCFAGKLELDADKKLETEFDAVKVGSSFETSNKLAAASIDQVPLLVDCSVDDDDDDDWVEVITGEEDISETDSGKGMTKDAAEHGSFEVKVGPESKPSPPGRSGYWTTYLVRVSRVKLAELLAAGANTNVSISSESTTEDNMQLDKHVCSSDYTGQGGNVEQETVNVQMAPAPFLWSEEESNQRRIDRDLGLSSLAQGLSELQVSIRNLGRQPSLSDLSGKSLVNLDTTALIALVSQLSNGGAPFFLQMDTPALQQRFGNMWSFIRDQAKSELESPLVPEIEAVLAARIPVISQFALQEFQSIVSIVGGPQEKERASSWLSRVRVLPNMPSVRVMALDETGKVKERHKIVFGTGDSWHAPTLTANGSFVRAARNTGMALAAIEHRPRALTGD